MKECVYGWYPPARDILKRQDVPLNIDTRSKPMTPQQMTTNRYRSRALSRSTPATEKCKPGVINLEIRGQGQLQYSRPATAASAKTHSTFSSRATPDESLFVARSGSHGQIRTPPCLGRAGRPVKAWYTKTTETNRIPGFTDYLREAAEQTGREELGLTPQLGPQLARQLITEPRGGYSRASTASDVRRQDGVLGTPSVRRDRIKSATTCRPKVHSHRPVRSAGPSRTPHDVIPETDTTDDIENHLNEVRRKLDEMAGGLSPDRSRDDGGEDENEEAMREIYARQMADFEEELGVDQPLDYEQQLEKYGWRMQVHGDPLNLKRPCIAKRLPFTEKISIPIIAPDPPKARSECFDTFFLNTIPRRPMTFTIDKEWASEVLHAKRMELQKRDGDTYKYRTANFSFVY